MARRLGHRPSRREDGYPAFWYSPDGPRQAVKVFHSVELPGLWDYLDWFEGPSWPRRVVPIELADGRTGWADIDSDLRHVILERPMPS